MFEYADAVGVADRGKPVRDQNGRALPRHCQDAIENLCFAAHVELRRRLVEQHDACAELHRTQRPRQRNALPLPAREISAAFVATREHGVERGEIRGARLLERAARSPRRRARGRNVVAQRKFEADEILKDRREARAPATKSKLAHVDAVHFDRSGLRIVEAAQQFGERRLARAVLADDGERRAGGNGEIEA